jgi:Rieske Fe-S protein
MSTRIGIAAGVLALVAAGLASYSVLRNDRQPDAWPIGSITEYPADTPVEVVIDHAYFDRFLPEGDATEANRHRSVAEARVWVVIRGGTEPVVYSQISPWLGCRVVAVTAADTAGFPNAPPTGFEVGFLDPCHGGLFSMDGQHLAGPGTEGLRRFRVRIDASGTLLVDLTDLQAG